MSVDCDVRVKRQKINQWEGGGAHCSHLFVFLVFNSVLEIIKNTAWTASWRASLNIFSKWKKPYRIGVIKSSYYSLNLGYHCGHLNIKTVYVISCSSFNYFALQSYILQLRRTYTVRVSTVFQICIRYCSRRSPMLILASPVLF